MVSPGDRVGATAAYDTGHGAADRKRTVLVHANRRPGKVDRLIWIKAAPGRVRIPLPALPPGGGFVMGGSHDGSVDDAVGPVACRACDLFEVCALINALPIASGLQRCPTLRPLARGEVLYRAGTPARHVYAVRKGIVKSTATRASGRSYAITLHVPGEVLGRESVVRGCHAHDVIAVTPAMICELPLEPYLQSHQELGPLRAGIERLGPLHTDSAGMKGGMRERLDAFVAELKARLRSRGIEPDFALDLRKRELAELLGLRALGRAGQRMQRAGSIRLQGHRVVLQKTP
jgi:CRP/FNR family transcriptional regulator